MSCLPQSRGPVAICLSSWLPSGSPFHEPEKAVTLGRSPGASAPVPSQTRPWPHPCVQFALWVFFPVRPKSPSLHPALGCLREVTCSCSGAAWSCRACPHGAPLSAGAPPRGPGSTGQTPPALSVLTRFCSVSAGAAGGPADSRGFIGPCCHGGGRLAAPGQRHPGPVRAAGTGDRPHHCSPGGSSLWEVDRAWASCR